jgi:hypothetical protein
MALLLNDHHASLDPIPASMLCLVDRAVLEGSTKC